MKTEVQQPEEYRARPVNWYSALERHQKAAFWSSFAGHAADAMDSQLYSFAIPALIALWGLTKGQAGAIGSVSLIMSAVGGWGAGIVADRFGRVRTLQWTILLFSLFSLLSGLAQNYGQLVAARGLLGLGFGGETAVSAVLVAEMIPTAFRGRAVGLVQGGWSIGWGVAAGLATLCQTLLPQALAWRTMFIVGVVPALLIVVLRRYVVEPEAFFLSRAGVERESVMQLTMKIFGRAYWRTTALASLMSAGIMGGFFAIMIWLPTYLKVVWGLSTINTGAYLAFVIFGSFSGYIIGSFLTDLLGRKKTLFLFSLGAVATILVYTQTSPGPGAGYLIWIGFPLGVFTSGIYAGIGAFLAELFPTSIRANAQGFSFNAGRAIGSIFPALIGYASEYMPLGTAICIFGIGAYGLLFVALLLLPETLGRELQE
jgi:MFS family permease